MDIDGIESGDPEFTKEIAKAINGSTAVLFFLSRDSQTSQWTLGELRVACKNKKNVVIVKFNEEPILDEFTLEFSGRDIIDWREPEQKEKLLRDMQIWIDELNQERVCAADNLCAEGNYSQAEEIYRECANRGDAIAAYKLGEMYEQGQGVKKDDNIALSWYNKAARLGDADMQYRAGVKYYDAGDYKQAVELFFDAAKGGQRDAQINLGKMHEQGRGVKKDVATAFKWYYEAAKRGDKDAHYALGRMYEHGRGVEKNRPEALRLYGIATSLGCEEAQMRIAESKKENGCLCRAFRLFKALVIVLALLGLAVTIAIIVILVKVGVISCG
jgi:tetratricopeptide (TPR) repeat protein